MKLCWCRWTRSPGTTVSYFDIGVSPNDSTCQLLPKHASEALLKNQPLSRSPTAVFPCPFILIFPNIYMTAFPVFLFLIWAWAVALVI